MFWVFNLNVDDIQSFLFPFPWFAYSHIQLEELNDLKIEITSFVNILYLQNCIGMSNCYTGMTQDRFIQQHFIL